MDDRALNQRGIAFTNGCCDCVRRRNQQVCVELFIVAIITAVYMCPFEGLTIHLLFSFSAHPVFQNIILFTYVKEFLSVPKI
jgi:hypothetical protein